MGPNLYNITVLEQIAWGYLGPNADEHAVDIGSVDGLAISDIDMGGTWFVHDCV